MCLLLCLAAITMSENDGEKSSGLGGMKLPDIRLMTWDSSFDTFPVWRDGVYHLAQAHGEAARELLRWHFQKLGRDMCAVNTPESIYSE